jgi:molybdopterin converting factor small subunit
VISITVRFLGGLRDDMGTSSTTLSVPSDATLRDLDSHLRALNIDPEADDIIITLNGQGLRQLPANQLLNTGDVIAVFPLISGG